MLSAKKIGSDNVAVDRRKKKRRRWDPQFISFDWTSWMEREIWMKREFLAWWIFDDNKSSPVVNSMNFQHDWIFSCELWISQHRIRSSLRSWIHNSNPFFIPFPISFFLLHVWKIWHRESLSRPFYPAMSWVITKKYVNLRTFLCLFYRIRRILLSSYYRIFEDFSLSWFPWQLEK